MKQNAINLLLIIGFVFSICTGSNAYVIQLDPWSYSMPENYTSIASNQAELDHFYYYTWCLPDLQSSSILGQRLEIVFHNIRDYKVEEDWLNVFIRDGVEDDTLGWNSYGDGQSLISPDWNSDPDWTWLGVWSDPDIGVYSTYDVVFYLDINETWAMNLTNGGSFVIGIDPDCHYFTNNISVNAPVPEPATLLLLGSGLIGFAAFRRKKSS